MLTFRSDYSLPVALLGLSLMLGYYGGYLPHHSVMYGILFTAAGLAASVAWIAVFVLTARLIATTIRGALQWSKHRVRPGNEG